MLFASKYGKEFVAAATELMPDCGVNRQLIELLCVRAPSTDKKLKLLKEIAEEHELDWDPAATETEFSKPQGDVLVGRNCCTWKFYLVFVENGSLSIGILWRIWEEFCTTRFDGVLACKI